MFQEQVPSCVLVGVLTREHVSGACFEQASSCVLVGVLTRERVSGACFRSKLPRVYRPLSFGCRPGNDVFAIYSDMEYRRGVVKTK